MVSNIFIFVGNVGSNEINEIAFCEKSNFGYCVSQEGLKSIGYDLDNERSQGKYLSPTILLY